jgi:hypothetical protein
MVALTSTYDPTNFFCLNQNIKPGVRARAGAGRRERRVDRNGP